MFEGIIEAEHRNDQTRTIEPINACSSALVIKRRTHPRETSEEFHSECNKKPTGWEIIRRFLRWFAGSAVLRFPSFEIPTIPENASSSSSHVKINRHESSNKPFFDKPEPTDPATRNSTQTVLEFPDKTNGRKSRETCRQRGIVLIFEYRKNVERTILIEVSRTRGLSYDRRDSAHEPIR